MFFFILFYYKHNAPQSPHPHHTPFVKTPNNASLLTGLPYGAKRPRVGHCSPQQLHAWSK
ncbi:hypothetical protein Hanom_Chr15g01383171 [Helianthus anomalus]